MSDAKTVAETVDLPAGLDVVPAVPGTFVGGHDVQGADGKTRTDRPGEILGTVAQTDADKDRAKTNRERETERADFVRSEVDRANREDLPKLGGHSADDGWEATSSRNDKVAVKPAAASPTAKPADKP